MEDEGGLGRGKKFYDRISDPCNIPDLIDTAEYLSCIEFTEKNQVGSKFDFMKKCMNLCAQTPRSKSKQINSSTRNLLTQFISRDQMTQLETQ